MNTFNYNDIISRYVPYNHLTIKGKLVTSLDDVISIQSSDLEPVICPNLSSGKIYVKMFNLDGTYSIEEFIKNPDFLIDSRAELDRVKQQLSVAMLEIEKLKKGVINNVQQTIPTTTTTTKSTTIEPTTIDEATNNTTTTKPTSHKKCEDSNKE